MAQAQVSEQTGEQNTFLKSTDIKRREEGELLEIHRIILDRMSIFIKLDISQRFGMFVNIPKELFHWAQEAEK